MDKDGLNYQDVFFYNATRLIGGDFGAQQAGKETKPQDVLFRSSTRSRALFNS